MPDVIEIVSGSWLWEEFEDRTNRCHACSGDGEFSSTGYLDGVLTVCETCNGTGEHQLHD